MLLANEEKYIVGGLRTQIQGYSDILRSRQLDEDEKFMYADAIYKNSKRLELLSSKMMSMLNLCENTIELVPTQIEVIEKRLPKLFEQNSNIIYELAPGIVKSEAELLLTLMRNLVENAIKASDGTPVTIIGKMMGSKYIISVVDQGKGMTKEQMGRAIEPFYKAERSRSEGGFGIGLSICGKICELHETILNIESKPMQGTTVSFTLEVCS